MRLAQENQQEVLALHPCPHHCYPKQKIPLQHKKCLFLRETCLFSTATSRKNQLLKLKNLTTLFTSVTKVSPALKF
jgi:hypothetical protein